MHLPPSSSEDDNGSKKEEIWWWEPQEDSLSFDFCRDTSLHGLKYLFQSQRHLSERIFWLVSFIIGLTVAVFMISGVWDNYRNKPIIVAFEAFETTVDDIPFPAITVCNMNKILKSKANVILEKLKHNADLSSEDMQQAFQLDHICSVSAGFSKAFNFSRSQGTVNDPRIKKSHQDSNDQDGELTIEDFLQQNSQTCPDMLPLCIWKDQKETCTKLFNPIETDFGKCCTFNMISQSLLHKYRNDSRDDPEEVRQWANWNVEENGLLLNEDDVLVGNVTREFPRRQRRAGKSFGLSILLDPNLPEYFCTTSDSVGFRLAAHLSIDVPHVADFGIGIAPNSEVFVNIRPEITTAEATIQGFPLDKRKCYFPKEYELNYYNYYTSSNCMDECIADQTQKSCSCVRYYMPRPENASLCGPSKFSCAEEVKKRYILQKGLKNDCIHCLRTCTEIQYFMETTTTPLLYDETNWMYDNGTFAHWRKNNVSIVHIFIGQPSTYARIRKQLYAGTELLANTGGLMGLCLGFSGLSLVEVLYYFTLRAWWRRKRRIDKDGSTVFNTVLDAWTKTKAFTTGGGGSYDKSSRMDHHNNTTSTNATTTDASRRNQFRRTNFGSRNHPELVREINSTFLMNHPTNLSHNGAGFGRSSRSDGGGGSMDARYNGAQAMLHEIYNNHNSHNQDILRRAQQTQYWHLS